MKRRRAWAFLPRGLREIDWKQPVSGKEVALTLVPILGILGLVVGVSARWWPLAIAGAALMVIDRVLSEGEGGGSGDGPFSKRLDGRRAASGTGDEEAGSD